MSDGPESDPEVDAALAEGPPEDDAADDADDAEVEVEADVGEIIEIPLEVDAARAGLRLDRFIASRIVRLSRTRIQAIVGAGKVRCAESGRLLVRPSIRVRVGQRLIIERPAPREPAVVLDYGVIFEDEHLLILDKPAGLPVHPSASYHRHTLTHLLRTRLGPGHGWELAHRLDRETSGVLVLGRRRGSGTVIKRAFLSREVHKRYWAIVHGEVVAAQSIEIPLGPALGSAIRVKMGARALDDGGMVARTAIRPLAAGTFRGAPVTLVEALPYTGRQHQIRVHLALIGHPVIGDKLYGVDESAFLDVAEGRRTLDELGDELGLRRHALHALSLSLAHPASGERMTFRSAWPKELAAIVPAPDPELAGDEGGPRSDEEAAPT
ncbi:MAG: RluA family pseudouridine synthase [Myxococcales bacterium]|nr:RluA family pseudouridine synthase [Myxococcales bacterium]